MVQKASEDFLVESCLLIFGKELLPFSKQIRGRGRELKGFFRNQQNGKRIETDSQLSSCHFSYWNFTLKNFWGLKELDLHSQDSDLDKKDEGRFLTGFYKNREKPCWITSLLWGIEVYSCFGLGLFLVLIWVYHISFTIRFCSHI